MTDEKNDSGTTTVRISKAHNAKLGKLAKQFGLSRQEFIEYSVMYFSRPGKDPREATEVGIMDRLSEMEKVLKRFQSDWHASKNSWEKNYLKPGMQADVQLYNLLDKLTNSNADAEIMAMQFMLTAYVLTPDSVRELGERKNILSRLYNVLSRLPLAPENVMKIKSMLDQMDSVQPYF